MGEKAAERAEVFLAAAHDRNDLQAVVQLLRELDMDPEVQASEATPKSPAVVGVTVGVERADAAREAVSRWQRERHERMKADEKRLARRFALWCVASAVAVAASFALGLRWEVAASLAAVLLVLVFVHPDAHSRAQPPRQTEEEDDDSDDDPPDAYWMEGAGEDSSAP